MRFRANVKILKGPVDPAAVLSVLLLLLLFILLSSQYVFLPGVKLSLPESSMKELGGVTGPTVAVVLDQAGRMYYGNQVVDEPTLAERFGVAVKRSRDPLTLVVLADKATRHEEIVRVSRLAKLAGIESAVLAVRPRPTLKPTLQKP